MNKIQIIVNNGAGTGSAVQVWKETKEYLLEKNIVYTAYLTRYEKHAARLARQICERHKEGPVYLLVVGGDGTINEVLNGITDFSRVRLGVDAPATGALLAAKFAGGIASLFLAFLFVRRMEA